MGEEAKQEEVKSETKTEEQVEEKAEEKKEENKPAPSPVVLFVDLHCVGCSKKIARTLMKVRGVEAIDINMGANQVTVKGVVDPQALCAIVQKKTKRRASILSPLPAAEGEPTPQFVTSQVSGLITVELNVDMHCEACAQQLKQKILKMRGVQTAETDLGSGKVTVTGTMDAQRLVDYVYRRTKKQARIVPQPEPVPVPVPEPEPKKEEEKKEGGEKPAEEPVKTEEEKKEEEKPAAEEVKNNNDQSNSTESKESEGKGDDQKVEESKEEAIAKQLEEEINNNEERIARMMHYHQYQPVYVIERLPAPQLFSDENPNACCIT